MRSPVLAMLWENWRLTRVEAALRLAMGIVAASAALVLFDIGATVAFWILLSLHGMFWFSIAKLNGGRFLDGYKPGFPLYLLYTRPVPTVMFVGVAMAYDAVSCAALYLVSAALLGFAFGQPLPLLSVIVCIVAFHLICTAIQWSTRNRVFQWLGTLAIWGLVLNLFKNRVTLPVEFSLAENALMASIGLVSFGLTVAGVARQRRGGVVATVPRAAGSGEYPDWLVNLFRFPCPTSSATRAQVWFELKSSGLPVLTIGLALAMLLALLFAISIPVPPVRPFVVFCVMISAPALLVLGSNAFGILRRQGRTYASAFEMSQPYSTAQLAGLRILVRTGCVLTALIAVGVSVWALSSLLSAWGASPVVEASGEAASVGLLRLRREIGDAFGGLTGYAHAAQAAVTSIAVALIVASFSVFTALRARYPRHVSIAGSLLLLFSLAFVLLAWAAQRGIGSEFLLHAMLRATGWMVAAAIIFGTAYLAWRALAERLLTSRQAWGVVLVSAAFGAAWVTVLRAAGMPIGGMPTTDAVWILSPVLLPLMASVLAPWSLSRIRHI